MTARRTLSDLRGSVYRELGDVAWATPSDVAARLGVGHGIGWLRVALVLERLANDGLAELETRGAAVRRFRRRREAA